MQAFLARHWSAPDSSTLLDWAADSTGVKAFHLRIVSEEPRAVLFGETWVYEEGAFGDTASALGRCRRSVL